MFFAAQTPASPQRFDVMSTVSLCSVIYVLTKDKIHPFAMQTALHDLCYYCGWTPRDVLNAEMQMRAYGNIDIANEATGSVKVPITRKDSA